MNALTLLLALRSPEVRLESVTTAGGPTAIRTAIALRLLELAGAAALVSGGHGRALRRSDSK